MHPEVPSLVSDIFCTIGMFILYYWFCVLFHRPSLMIIDCKLVSSACCDICGDV